MKILVSSYLAKCCQNQPELSLIKGSRFIFCTHSETLSSHSFIQKCGDVFAAARVAASHWIVIDIGLGERVRNVSACRCPATIQSGMVQVHTPSLSRMTLGSLYVADPFVFLPFIF